MQGYLLVEQAVHVRSQRSHHFLQAVYGGHAHACRLLGTQTKEDSQDRNDGSEREKGQDRGQQVEEDIQRHLGLIRGYKPFYQMKEIHIICDNFRVRSSVYAGQTPHWAYRNTYV